MERELNSIKAIVQFGLIEFDLAASVTNPFQKLDMGARGVAPVVQRDARDPLPANVIEGVRNQLQLESKRPELSLIWRLLEGTGCRPSEVSGLRVSDVRLDHEIPHIIIAWHEDRGVKTESSHRSIPLVGDAYTAAVEALRKAEGGTLLFPRYSGQNGPDRLSSILNKHVD
ncbi:hypothetical protein [Donghicola sp.]|jgi:integrase|uniref:hypothetical protein n=1 Tax=Donghicola sp. TaxID=1929294 RepID=UPI0025D96C2A|nr:hypothetical protein [Donghicola sp.]MCT4576030.1 hypothetical protein [Donghicola sp.]